MSTVALENGTPSAAIYLTFSGYLIPAGQLPATADHPVAPNNGLPLKGAPSH